MVTVGMGKRIARVPAQAFGAAWDAIGITPEGEVAVLILGHRHASTLGHLLVDVLHVEGGICRDVDWQRLQRERHPLVERLEGRDIA